jgi:hypothetical protein
MKAKTASMESNLSPFNLKTAFFKLKALIKSRKKPSLFSERRTQGQRHAGAHSSPE